MEVIIESFISKYDELCRIGMFEEPLDIVTAVHSMEFGFGGLSRNTVFDTMIAWERQVYESFTYHKKICGAKAHHSMRGEDGNIPILGCGQKGCQLKGKDIDRLLLTEREAVLLMDIVHHLETSDNSNVDRYDFDVKGVKKLLNF